MMSRLFDDSKPGKAMRFVRGELLPNVLVIHYFRSPNDTKPYHQESHPVSNIPKSRRRIYNWLMNKAVNSHVGT